MRRLPSGYIGKVCRFGRNSRPEAWAFLKLPSRIRGDSDPQDPTACRRNCNPWALPVFPADHRAGHLLRMTIRRRNRAKLCTGALLPLICVQTNQFFLIACLFFFSHSFHCRKQPWFRNFLQHFYSPFGDRFFRHRLLIILTCHMPENKISPVILFQFLCN